MIKYLLLLLLAAPSAEAQSTCSKHAARKINRIVRQIQADTSLTRVLKGDTVSRENQLFPLRRRNSISYFSNGSLVRFRAGHLEGIYLSGFSRDYYFQDGKLIYLHEEMSNSRRMGSCGTVTVKYDYYLQNDQLICFRRGQPHNFYETCYGDMGPKAVPQIKAALEADKKSGE